MPLHFPGFLTSKALEVKCKDKSFFVHSKILIAQSGPLRSSITGVWKEATEGKIELLDWDSETVGRFIEFLYTEDYHVSASEESEGWGDDGEVNTPYTFRCSPDQEELGIKDKNILRVHAKVYALAQYKDVEALREMALEKLKEELRGIGRRYSTLVEAPEVVLGVVELLDYVYSNTDALTNSAEPMRDLTSKFAAENFENLMVQREMVLLLGGEGDPIVELMNKVAGRLRVLEGGVQEWKDRATSLEEKMRESAAANAEDFKNSKAQYMTRIRLLEFRNFERISQLEKVRDLEAANADNLQKFERKMRELEVANAVNVQELKDRMQQLEAANAEAEMQRPLEDKRTRARKPSTMFHFLINVCICCNAIYRLGFRATMRELEGQVDEWMLKDWVFMYLVAGSFAIYLVVVFLLVFAVIGLVTIVV